MTILMTDRRLTCHSHPFVIRPPGVADLHAAMLHLVSAAVAAPTPSNWYDGIPSIAVFSPGDAVEQYAWNLYHSTASGQFSSGRHALLLRSGEYTDQIPTGYYTSVVGVGERAEDVRIGSFYALDNPDFGNACDNFWRSVEGVTTTTSEPVTWAASQAAPLRRVHVSGTLTLSEEGPGTHWSSGGYLADSTVDGVLRMGTQQQYFVRNADLNMSEVGTSKNYVFVGVRGAPAPSSDGSISVVDSTPSVAAKPYLVEEVDGAWHIAVPPAVEGSRGPLAQGGARIAMADVYVARPGESAAAINAGIAGKKGLLLTPAIYALDAPIVVGADGFVVLGIGFPTLVATGGASALVVNASGARVAGVLLEAGTDVDAPATEPLMRWSGAAGVGSDIFSRAGAFNYSAPGKPACMRTRADVHVAVDGDGVTLDNTWLWHADHDGARGGRGRAGWDGQGGARGKDAWW